MVFASPLVAPLGFAPVVPVCFSLPNRYGHASLSLATSPS